MTPLDMLYFVRQSSHLTGEVVDIAAGTETLLVQSFGSATLTLDSGDASDSVTAITGADAGNAAGDDSAQNMLAIQIIRPGRRFYKIHADAGKPVLVQQFSNRKDPAVVDATMKKSVSLNSPDFGATALRPDGYPQQASI